MEFFYTGVVLLNILAVLTVVIRPLLFHTKLYRPMLKNIFLSVIPVIMLIVVALVSINIAYRGYLVGEYYLVIIAFVVGSLGMVAWLLMLPNAGYLITELNLNHRDIDTVEVPLWYDIIGVLTLSMSGVINTLANVMLVQMLYIGLFYPTMILDVTFSGHPFLWIMAGVLFALVAIGIYIGRYTRLNSWDVVHPTSLGRKLKEHFTQKGSAKSLILFTVFYTAFFLVLYTIMVVPLFEGGLLW